MLVTVIDHRTKTTSVIDCNMYLLVCEAVNGLASSYLTLKNCFCSYIAMLSVLVHGLKDNSATRHSVVMVQVHGTVSLQI